MSDPVTSNERVETQQHIAESLRSIADNIEAYEFADSAELLRRYARILDSSSHEPSDAPVAWIIPGDDNAYSNGALDARISQEGEFTRPLYARPAPPPCAARSETAWLVEMDFDGKAHYWYGSDFIDDPEQAIRFARQHDAQQLIMERGLVEARAAEHMWINDMSGPSGGTSIYDEATVMRVLRECEAALAFAESYREVTTAQDGERITQALTRLRQLNGDRTRTPVAAQPPGREQQFRALLERAQPLLIAAGMYSSSAVDAKTQLLTDIASTLTKGSAL